MPPLKFLTLPAIKKHTATVIFIHGLGDSGHGWKPVAEHLRDKDPDMHHIKWIFPHSPVRCVTANGGLEMPSWFDVRSFGLDSIEDDKGMMDSKSLINQLVVNEIRAGTPPDRILLGGFSQGGAMSLLVGLTGEHKLAALAILSSWLPLRSRFKAMVAPHASSTPIFWGYGGNDKLIIPRLTNDSIGLLEAAIGHGISRKVYPGMGHEANPEELKDLKAFIQKHLPI